MRGQDGSTPGTPVPAPFLCLQNRPARRTVYKRQRSHRWGGFRETVTCSVTLRLCLKKQRQRQVWPREQTAQERGLRHEVTRLHPARLTLCVGLHVPKSTTRASATSMSDHPLQASSRGCPLLSFTRRPFARRRPKL